MLWTEEILSKSAAVRAGADEVATYTKDQYLDKLTWLREAVKYNFFNQINPFNRSIVRRVSQTLENLLLDDSNGRIRKQPFCIMLSGYPGVGKTSAAMKIAAAFMTERYGEFRSSDIVTLNETDDYQSEFRTNHKVVIFDDIGAEKSTMANINPWRKVIDFVNNIRKTALNPNVELKGNVYIEPDLVIMTTNSSPTARYSTTDWLNCPQAIMRRISAHVYLINFEEACVCKITHRLPSTDIREVNSIPTTFSDYGIPSLPCGVHAEPKLLEDVVSALVIDFTEHMQKQEEFVTSINSMFIDHPTKTPSQAFFDDMIYPRLPTKLCMPIYLEMQLPWYHKIIRKFCREDKSLAMMQTQAGPLSKDLVKSLTNLEIDSSIFEDARSDYYLREHLNIEHYLLFRRSLREMRYSIIESGFLSADGYPYTVIPIDLKDTRPTLTFSLDQIDRIAEEILSEDLEDLSSSETERIETSYQLLPVEKYCTHKYHEEGSTPRIRDLDTLLLNCQRKLIEMTPDVETKLVKTESSFIQYQFLRRAWHAKLTLIGCEVPYYGLTPDVLFKSDSITYVVELKGVNSPETQLFRYMREIASHEQRVIGIGWTNTHFRTYSIGNVTEKEKKVAIHVADAVIAFCKKAGRHFGLQYFNKAKRVEDRCPKAWIR